MTNDIVKPIYLSVEITRVTEAVKNGYAVRAKSTRLLEIPVVNIKDAHRLIKDALEECRVTWINQANPDLSHIRISINEEQTTDTPDLIGRVISRRFDLPENFFS